MRAAQGTWTGSWERVKGRAGKGKKLFKATLPLLTRPPSLTSQLQTSIKPITFQNPHLRVHLTLLFKANTLPNRDKSSFFLGLLRVK